MKNERAARAWAFRRDVELCAERGFRAIAREFEALGYPKELVTAADEVADDESRHAELCTRLAEDFGATLGEVSTERLAPESFSRENALAYEIVARCCVAETESTATLVQLLKSAGPIVKDVVRQIAEDEVRHARLGWQFLAYEAPRRDLKFLGTRLPAMLETGGGPLFQSIEETDLAELGVFSRATQRTLFEETLDGVILPGFELHGIPTDAVRQWLKDRQ